MKRLEGRDQIYEVLKGFLPYMPRLLEKINDFEAYIDKLSLNAYVIIDQEDDKGLIVFYANDFKDRIGFISLIVVKDEYRKTGVGKNLIQCATKLMKEKKMRVIRLCVNNDNDNAIGFYKHLGFEIVGTSHLSTGYLMSKNI